jgi:NAD(P)H dehydrogenase (quinone)
MPKLLVLFDARSDDVSRIAEAIAEGARGVRFAEVELRRVPPGGAEHRPAGDDARGRQGARHRMLESADALADYDAIVVGVEAGAAQGPDAVRALIETATVNLANKVASAFTPEGSSASESEQRAALASVLTPMGERGMIIVPPRFADRGDDELHTARKQGKRVYDVTGWITHARSHHHH